MTLRKRARRWGLFLRRLQLEIAYDDCMGMAAQIAFYLMLGLFPTLIFILSLLSYLPLGADLSAQVLDALRRQLPSPEAFRLVAGTLEGLLEGRSHELLSFSLLAALWSGSMGVGALITTINRAYNLRPRRSMLTQKLLSIVLTLGLAAIWLLSSTIVLFGPRVTEAVLQWLGLGLGSAELWTTLRLPLAFGLNLAALSILYYFAPEARQQFRWILPGAATSTALWLAGSSLFRLFVRNFGNYNQTYGSLTAVVVLMVWFWMTGFILLLGAEVNALMKRLEHRDGSRKVRLLR